MYTIQYNHTNQIVSMYYSKYILQFKYRLIQSYDFNYLNGITYCKKMFRLWRAYSPIKLGRWAVGSSSSAINKRIDLANHDHCGPCSTQDIKRPPSNCFDNSMDISICALQSLSVYPSRKSNKK